MGSISPAVTLSVGLWNPCFQSLTFFFSRKVGLSSSCSMEFIVVLLKYAKPSLKKKKKKERNRYIGKGFIQMQLRIGKSSTWI